jgi:hypothetical protein
MDMHKNFAEWYRLVSIEPRGDVLKSRWAGVETWSVSLSDDAVLETVRIFQTIRANSLHRPLFSPSIPAPLLFAALMSWQGIRLNPRS